MHFETPILFLVFNRPDTTRRVFERIRAIKPKYLYVAADGPRMDREGEKSKTEEVRRIVMNGIDWNCEVKTLFREQNLGCGQAVSQAITWFFENVKMGIILEDDILPDLSFFPFCEELLEEYKNDTRVMMISGFNHQIKWQVDYSYFFAFYGGIWGWATWKRAWEKYDFRISLWDEIKAQKVLDKVLFQKEIFIKNRVELVDRVLKGEINTWDYQWGIARITNSGLSIIPRKSLISNIGFGKNATHTKHSNSHLSNSKLFSASFPLIHNPYVVPDRNYDDEFMNSIVPTVAQINKKSFLRKFYEKFN